MRAGPWGGGFPSWLQLDPLRGGFRGSLRQGVGFGRSFVPIGEGKGSLLRFQPLTSHIPAG